MTQLLARLIAAVLSPKSLLFSEGAANWPYTDSGAAEPKIVYSTSPASGFRRTFEAQGLGAHVARRARTAPPRPRSTPLTSTRSFVSRRDKSRGDPRSRTRLQCGQAIVREGAQRPGIKVPRSMGMVRMPIAAPSQDHPGRVPRVLFFVRAPPSTFPACLPLLFRPGQMPATSSTKL